MKNLVMSFALFFSLLATVSLMMPLTASAEKAPNCGKDSSQKDVAYCCGKDTSGNDIATSIDFGSLCDKPGASPLTAMLLWVINFLSIGVGVAVVVGIVMAGILYAMSDGDASKVKQARDIITNSIIGLFLFLFMFAAANFMIPGGLFK